MNQVEIKYTTDGRKVAVVGKLNSQETIVQEIFISNGNEIPSGENFVVKSLHDAPVVSWKEAELKKLEERYNKEKANYELELDRLYKERREKGHKIMEILSYQDKLIKHLPKNEFDRLSMILSGEIEWVVVDRDYMLPQIWKFEDWKLAEDGDKKLKLLTVWGEDDGTMTYGLGNYASYSSSFESKNVNFFRDKESAEACYADLLRKQSISDNVIVAAKKYNVTLDPEKLEVFKQSKIASENKAIEDYKKQILDRENNIKKYEAL